MQEVIKFYDVEGIIEITREDFEGKYQKELNKNEARLFWKEKLAEDFKRIENDVALNFIEEAEKVRIAEGKMILKDTEEIRSMKPFFRPNKKKEDKSMWN